MQSGASGPAWLGWALGWEHHMRATIVPHRFMAREITARPKARFFGFLAVMWAGVALIGWLLLWFGWPDSASNEIRRLAWLVLIPEPIFLGLTIFFRVVEKPRKVPAPSDWEGPVIH